MIPLADYYIIAGVVYQAPDLGTVISSRAVRMENMNLHNNKVYSNVIIMYYKWYE